MILLSNGSASMSYEKRQSADEERELERDAGLLKEKGASISSEERQNKKRNKKLE